MQITAPCVVTLTWKLSDAQGLAIDELTEPVEFFYGGDDLLPKVEEALEGHEVGHHAVLHLEPEHAFGDYDAELVCFEQRSLFPELVGARHAVRGPAAGQRSHGMPSDAIYTVTEVYPTHVVLDANHPLAGMALNIDLTVRDVREATAAEIEARTVTGIEMAIADMPPPGRPLH
jgi:FKBP-type peptidyl-prolyl cis-trans isomerase SlyD